MQGQQISSSRSKFNIHENHENVVEYTQSESCGGTVNRLLSRLDAAT